MGHLHKVHFDAPLGGCVAWDRSSNLLAVTLEPGDRAGGGSLRVGVLDPEHVEVSGARRVVGGGWVGGTAAISPPDLNGRPASEGPSMLRARSGSRSGALALLLPAAAVLGAELRDAAYAAGRGGGVNRRAALVAARRREVRGGAPAPAASE